MEGEEGWKGGRGASESDVLCLNVVSGFKGRWRKIDRGQEETGESLDVDMPCRVCTETNNWLSSCRPWQVEVRERERESESARGRRRRERGGKEVGEKSGERGQLWPVCL